MTRSGRGNAGGGRVASMVGARALNAALQLAVIALISRSLDVRALGEFFTIVAVASIAAGVTGLGLATRALRLAAEPMPGGAARMTAAGALATVLAAAASVALGLTVWGYSTALVIAATVFAVAETYTSLCVNILQGQDRHRRAVIALVARRVVATAAVLVPLVTPAVSMTTAITVGFSGAIVVTQVLVGRLPWHGLRLGETVRTSLHFWHSSLWSTAQQADVILVTAIAGPEVSGVYALAVRITAPIHLVTGSIVQVMVPAVSAVARREGGSLADQDLSARPYVRAGWAYTAALVAAAPAAAWLAPYLLGDLPDGARPLIAVLVLARAVSVSSQIDGGRLVARHRERDVATVNAWSTVMSLAGVAAVAPLGTVWPAVAFLASRVYARLHLWRMLRWSRET